jgi:hypothetical protein
MTDRADFSVEQTIQLALILLKLRRERFAVKLLLPLIKDQMQNPEQRLEAINHFFTIKSTKLSEVVQVVRTVLTLLNEQDAKQYFKDRWPKNDSWPIRYNGEEILADIPVLAELSQQAILPSRARNRAYMELRHLVPKFNKITLSDNNV